MLGQMDLVQDLSQKQGELRVLVNQLLRDNQLGQTSKVEEQAIIQPPVGQEDKGKAHQFASGSQAQHQPHQCQQGNRRKRNTFGRHFSETGIPSSLILRHLLEVKLIALKDPPKNLNITSLKYNPDERCAYHSDSPGHDTDDCWSLRNKIQDLIDRRVLEFMPGGKMKIFC